VTFHCTVALLVAYGRRSLYGHLDLYDNAKTIRHR
jgi:hypothetical protein